MGAVSRAGALDRHWDANDAARFGEGNDVILPRALVEVGREKPARLVLEERVHAHDVPALEVVEYHLIADRQERLIRALAALATRLQDADAAHEFVRALWGVPGIAGFLADEARREDVFASAKQRAEEPHLLGRRLRNSAAGRRVERQELGRPRRCARELRLQGFTSRLCFFASPLELGETLLLAGDLLQYRFSGASHVRRLGARAPTSSEGSKPAQTLPQPIRRGC